VTGTAISDGVTPAVRCFASHLSSARAAIFCLIDMTEDREEKVEDRLVEDYDRDRRLNEEQSSENPDRVATFNRRADKKRERYSRDNYQESLFGNETERKAGPD
jgi:hypothetical protein